MAAIDEDAKRAIEGMKTGSIEISDDVGLTALEAAVKKRDDTVRQATAARTALTAASNERKAAERALRTLLVRLRASVKGKYGTDSTEYELVGGTRTSERKKPSAKA